MGYVKFFVTFISYKKNLKLFNLKLNDTWNIY